MARCSEMALMSTLRAINLDPSGRRRGVGVMVKWWELTIGAVGARSDDLAVQVKLDEIRKGDC
jgi:hypothetical protein